MREHLPSFRFVLDDLSTRSDEDIRGRSMAVLGRVSLLLLRHVRATRNDLRALQILIGRIGDLLRLIPRSVDRRVAIAYILNVSDADRDKVEAALADTLPDLKEDVVTVADQIRLEGELLGRRDMFLRVLAERFGAASVTAEVKAQVNQADKAMIDSWFTRAFRVNTIEGVFKP